MLGIKNENRLVNILRKTPSYVTMSSKKKAAIMILALLVVPITINYAFAEVGEPGMTIRTEGGRFSVQLIVTPPILGGGSTAKFFITFFNPTTQDTEKNIVYDFAVVQGDQKIVDRKQVQALTGNAVEEVKFAREQSGIFTVRIDNIHYVTEPPDPTKDHVSFTVDVVKVAEPKAVGEAMPPMMQGTLGKRFNVEMVFSPAVIEPDKPQSFALSFFNPKTDAVERNAVYDFAIIKDNKVLINREGQSAPTGVAVEKFTFSKEQTGSIAVKVSNVRLLGESFPTADETTFSINVVPEFPLGIMLIATSAIAAMIVVGRFKKLPHL